MTQRAFERDLLRDRHGWRRVRAHLAATARYRPDDAQEISHWREILSPMRTIEMILELHRRGDLDALTTVELIGPSLCPDAIAEPDSWGWIR